ncbi:MAG: S8 family serine peptidase, partial [Candidatus Omnitrophica bacterium]|nr:S8 family serine peptidase [Candidatus Omnitrophota bacterium]
MRRISFLGFAILLVFGLATSSSAQPGAPERGAEAVPGEVLVKFTAEAARAIEAARVHHTLLSGIASLDALCATYGVTAIERVFPETNPEPSGLGIERWYRLRLAPGQGIEAAVAAFAQDPAHVEAAQPNYRIKLEQPVADPPDPAQSPEPSSSGSHVPQFGHLSVSGGPPGERLSLRIGATDPDGDRLSLRLDERTPLPETAEVRTIASVPGRLEAEVHWTPQATDTSRDLRFLVSDGTTPPVSAPPASFLVSAPVPPHEPPASEPPASNPNNPVAAAPPPQDPPLAPILPARSTIAAASTSPLASTSQPGAASGTLGRSMSKLQLNQPPSPVPHPVAPEPTPTQPAASTPSATPQPSDPTPPAQAASPAEGPRYVKGEIIIKFKDNLKECAHCLLEKKRLRKQARPFTTALSDFSGSIDDLNERFGVSGGHSVFVQRHGRSTADAQALERQRHAEWRRQFAKQAARIPPDAELPDLTNVYVFEVPPQTDIEQAVAAYAADHLHVEYAQLNYVFTTQEADEPVSTTSLVPNDPYYSSRGSWGQPYEDLWNLKKIQAQQAWDITQGRDIITGEPIVVAVVDSGLDYYHPDISANVWVNPREIPNNGIDDDGNGYVDDVRGFDFVNSRDANGDGDYDDPGDVNDPDPMDDEGHGTYVAGTIAAVGHNHLGMIGVAPQTKIMPLKALDREGNGDSERFARALRYAAQNGARVINNSWGCTHVERSIPIEEEAVREAYGHGAVVIFAAGNSHNDVELCSPQNMTNPKPIVVGASTPDDVAASFSDVGVFLDIVAPGGGTEVPPPTYQPSRNILSLRASACDAGRCDPRLTVGTRYRRAAGTSAAAPHAAGVAALVLAAHPLFTPEEVRQALRASADEVGSPGFDIDTGAGRLNAAKAVRVESVLRVKMTSPSSGTTFNPQIGSIVITGTVAGPGFQQYQLSYRRRDASTEWLPIGSPVFTPVEEGVLGIWPIREVPTGTYLVRVVATTFRGLQFQEVTGVSVELPPRQITTDPHTQVKPIV